MQTQPDNVVEQLLRGNGECLVKDQSPKTVMSWNRMRHITSSLSMFLAVRSY